MRRAATESLRDQKNYKSKTWLFSLCSKLNTDAVNTNNTPSLGHFLEVERRAASNFRRNQNVAIYERNDFSSASNPNSLLADGQIATHSNASLGTDSETGSNRGLLEHGNGSGAPLLFSCIRGQLVERWILIERALFQLLRVLSRLFLYLGNFAESYAFKFHWLIVLRIEIVLGLSIQISWWISYSHFQSFTFKLTIFLSQKLSLLNRWDWIQPPPKLLPWPWTLHSSPTSPMLPTSFPASLRLDPMPHQSQGTTLHWPTCSYLASWKVHKAIPNTDSRHKNSN